MNNTAYPGNLNKSSFDDAEFSRFLNAWIDDHKDEMLDVLLSLLRIHSVQGPPEEGKPFGPAVDRTLKLFCELGERYGMKMKDVDGYAAHAEVGAGDELVMALTHLDVVPAGSGWTRDPAGEIFQGRVYGRGAQDNKGPTVACLFALRALLESGVPLKRRVRHVVGGDEETGFRCVRRYFEAEERPTYGFSPDACFPLVFAEKGNMNVQVEVALPSEQGICRILEISGGERANIVASSASAVLSVPAGTEDEIAAAIEKALPDARALVGGPGTLDLSIHKEKGRLSVSVAGKAAHASTPSEGTNALTGLLFVLSSLRERLDAWEGLRFAADAADIFGRGLGIQCEDEVSGKLSCNLGIVRTVGAAVNSNGTRAVQGIYNIRYPVNVSGDDLRQRVLAFPHPDGVTIRVPSVGKPHYTDPDSFLVKTLLRVYGEETGDMSPPIAIGGGTYAKAIPGAVAFGPQMPGSVEVAHQVDEFIDIDDFFLLVRIYARALLALAM